MPENHGWIRLRRNQVDYFDMNLVQLRDFERDRVSWEDYLKLCFIGHHNPRGNHLFAYPIKDEVVAMLDPKPVPYRERDGAPVDFQGCLKPAQSQRVAAQSFTFSFRKH